MSSRNVGCFLGLNLQQNMLFSNPFQRDIVTHLTATNFWISIASKKGLQILVGAMNSHICLSRVHNSIYSHFKSPRQKASLIQYLPSVVTTINICPEVRFLFLFPTFLFLFKMIF